MMRKISKNPVKKRREEKRLANLEKEGRIVQGVEIPKGALPADPHAQAHRGGYSPKLYYKDVGYKCAGCGKDDVWTAEQQKRYFEDQKGNIYNQPKWCYECHLKRMQKKDETDNKKAEQGSA